MFITNLIKRKLASLLQPWLLQEPELELKLGFLRSYGIVKNLRFNTSALNELLDDSISFYFTDFRVDRLTLRISTWSAPAFNWELQGFHVTISPRVVEGSERSREPSEVLLDEKKKVLREIDPEGSALHDIMEKLADIALSRSQTPALPKLIVNYCCLQMCDINLRLQHAISDNSLECLWEMEELNVDSRLVKPQSFLRGYISSLFVSSKESYFDLELRGLEIKLKSNEQIIPVGYATNIICAVKLNDLQLIDLHCSIEELVISFSPIDVSIISVLVRELSRKSSPIRNGRQLWKENTTRIRSLISRRRWSMWKLVNVVCLWLRYVHAWDNLFLLIGYPTDIMIKRSAVKMSKNQIFSKSFMRQWQVISEIEQEIPAPAIALAHRVVRGRTVKNVIPSKDELPVTRYLEYFQKSCQSFGRIWSTFCSMLNSITHWAFLRNSFASHPKMKKIGVLPTDSCTNLCYKLNLGKISVTISPDNAIPSVGKRTVSDRRVSDLDLLSFSLLIDTLILVYQENICEHQSIFSCRSFKVMYSSATRNKHGYSSKGRQKHQVLDSKTILWSKPALVFNHENTEMVSLPLLESLLNEMWLDWKISCAEFEKTTDEQLNDPFVLCEIKHLLTDQGHNSLSYHFTRCCLALGQLDVSLGYSSTLSLAILLQQIQKAFSWPTEMKSHKSTPKSFEDPPVRVWDCHSRISGVEEALHKVLPEKLIQVGVYVVGPQIRMSLRKDSLHSRSTNLHEADDDIHLSFDCKNVELIMSPILADNSTILNDAIHMKELQIVDLGKSDNESFRCQGQIMLDASLKIHGIIANLDDWPELQQSQIMTLKPISLQLSTIRKDAWSLGESVSAFSAVLHGNASGLSGLIFVDELSVLAENLSVHFLPDSGIHISVHQMHMMLSYKKKERKMEGLANFFGLRAVIFKYANDVTNTPDKHDIRDLLPRHQDVCELSVSNCTFSLSLTYLPHELPSSHREVVSSTSGSNILHTMENPILTNNSEEVIAQSPKDNQNTSLAQSTVAPVSNTCLHARISSTEIYMIGCPLKDVIVGKHQSSKLEISLSSDGGCQTISSCHCQGGIIFFETISAVLFSQCGNSYIRRVRHLLRGAPSFQENQAAADSANVTILVDYPSQGTRTVPQQGMQGISEDFTMGLSQFYFALMARDESGRLQELLFGADMHLDLKVVNMRRKLSFGLPHFSILSRVLQEFNRHQSNEVQIPIMSSSTSSDPSFHLIPKDMEATHGNTDEIHPVTTDASSSTSDSRIELRSQDSHQGPANYILKQLSCFIAVEEPVPKDPSDTLKSDQHWVGSGSISGFDVTISLSEMQMMLSVAELSGGSSKETTASVQQRQLHIDEEPVRKLEEMVQDGSIIAIQDVHQHMYIVVEGAERKYHLAGAMHYSLAREMALFRVKYHYQRIWKSTYLWFSLTSLCAKSESGEHLQLNCNSRSNFVELSSSGNSGSALWRSLPCKSTGFEDDSELESYNNVEKNLFYLINRKNNCSIAFVEGVLEFVSSPRNPFKWKVFQDFALARDPLLLDTLEDSKTGAQDTLHADKGKSTESTWALPLIDIKIDKISLTLYHEIPDTTEKLPLLQMSMVVPEFSIEILHAKTRFRVSVMELSLDILLFVIGKLNLAGPYAIQSSLLLANCCKVENQSDLFLLCKFSDKQIVTIARKQSTTVFLRNLASNQPPKASNVSIQLAERGDFMTVPIKFSLLKADSKRFPGPFVIVEITWKSEDGLSIVVSPLLRIHNKTDFPIELRFQQPVQEENEDALVLKAGDTVDDSTAAFDVIKTSGNFIFSFRPKISDDSRNFKNLASMGWSDELKGGKAARLSGLFDKISYHVRNAFPVESAKSSFSTARTSSKSKEGEVDDLHFLIQSTRRDVPILQPDGSEHAIEGRASTVALLEQNEIYILPTVQISNLVQSEIHVLLTDKDRYLPQDSENMSKQATIPCRSSVNLYSNPEAMFFTVTLTALGLSCKPVNCGDWAKKLLKQKKDNRNLDMELNFGDGIYFCSLRLSCGHRGILEAAIFTPYTLKNNTDFDLFCLAPNQNPLSRNEAEELRSQGYSQLGVLLPPKSAISWFFRTNKVSLKLLHDKATKAQLDLDAVSGLTEINLEVEEGPGLKYITKLGVSLHSTIRKVVPSQVVSLSPRYVLANESDEVITVRQCNLEDEMQGVTTVSSKQRKALQLCNRTSKKRETSIFENFIRKHKNVQDDSLLFIQFRLNEAGLNWSGPVCVASMGRFFLKFRRSTNITVEEIDQETASEENKQEFAVVVVSEEDSSLVLRFHRPPNMNFPYRIENGLCDASITYYQKGSTELETLGSAKQVNYVWDDLSLTHRLVIQISGLHMLREVNLDKVRAWKPFYKFGQHRVLGFNFPLDKKAGDKVKLRSSSNFNEMEMVNLGYEVYADGLTRVLRICERNDSRKLDKVFYPGAKIALRVSRFAIHFSERAKQSVSVDQKWVGAPFAAMLRRHQTGFSDTSDSMLRVVLILLPSSSNIRQVKYSSIVLQPVDLNLDEETLMKIVPFYRTSLSDPNTPSQQYYFDHFEIHPVKIIASFLPGDSYSSYNSTQETMRSLLHSVIKVPEIKNKTVELNGVLVTSALITIRELSIKCAQHYSWYAMRAIYIAKGSPLLPPAFASIFDDLASSSLDVFFDPSSTFKLLSKCIDGKGFTGTKRYLGDLGKTLKTAGSNILFAAVTEISDSVLRGAETSGVDGMFSGFRQGILKLAMEPSVLGSAFMEGGPDRKIKLDRNPGIDELYIEGYLQAMLDTMYKHEYLRVRVIDDQEWRIGPTVLTLCEHLFVNFAIGWLRKQAGDMTSKIKWENKFKGKPEKATKQPSKMSVLKWGVGQFVFAGIVAYVDGRLCRSIPNPVARRIVSGFVLSFLDRNDDK
ncbi:Vacuolar protein sorting-associated protein 13 domain-containing protein [Cynara cardunculus var. scolymus]|uniref:Vacuolar protein sorting-associated protein 13 domain-containing protein n=1 Tax=Cynara cardunculus var. scolymus TaxID=59895 RepID=A0A103Y504_CYNCS|nr:Vacuolar protein sorting-associated protein 13 domain-containing protein [Cynara cardunculus var. scolymus]